MDRFPLTLIGAALFPPPHAAQPSRGSRPTMALLQPNPQGRPFRAQAAGDAANAASSSRSAIYDLGRRRLQTGTIERAG